MARLRIQIVGHAQEQEPILDGAGVFRLMDERGVPLDIINDVLRERKAGFDVLAFVSAARASGNYSDERLRVLGLPEEALI